MSRLYFYAGQSQKIKGEITLFYGTWHNKEGKTHTEGMQQIIEDREREYGCQCVLTTFNALPDKETTGERL